MSCQILVTGSALFTLFHKVRQKHNIPLVLPTLKINNTLINWADDIKFLGALFNENLTWKNHVNLIENNILKSLGIEPNFR